jgi:UDP-N-acetylmuramyl pentapeptide synthase
MKNMFKKILQQCARMYIYRHDPFVIGITGSIGKTSSRMIVARVLETFLPDIQISTSPKNFNSDVGIALSILEVESFDPKHILRVLWTVWSAIMRCIWGRRYDVIVLEYGIDAPWDMDILLNICVPHIAIFTW